MAIETFSQFWLLDPVQDTNFYLPFDEGAGEIVAEVETGEYTITDIAEAVEDAMNAVAVSNTYTVTLDRTTRTFTITGDTTTFSLLITSGSSIGVDIYGLLGFSGADTAFALSHESNSAAGTVFAPQFILQDYIPSSDLENATSAAVNETASGDIEVVSFGTTNMIEMSIMFATNIEQPEFGPIRNNPNGLEDLRNFMRFARQKYPFEFIPDEDDINTYEKVILERTLTNRDGVGFKIKHMIGDKLPGYYETGLLTLRVKV